MKLTYIALSLGLGLLSVSAQDAVAGSLDGMQVFTMDSIIVAQGSTGSGGGSGAGTDMGGGSPGSGISAMESTTGSGTSSSEDFRKAPPCDIKDGDAERKAEQHAAQDSHMIRGEVMRVEGSNYVVKQQDGKQVSLKTDETTTQPVIHQGQHIEANVNEQHLALWIRTNNETDRRNEHAATDCTPK